MNTPPVAPADNSGGRRKAKADPKAGGKSEEEDVLGGNALHASSAPLDKSASGAHPSTGAHQSADAGAKVMPGQSHTGQFDPKGQKDDVSSGRNPQNQRSDQLRGMEKPQYPKSGEKPDEEWDSKKIGQSGQSGQPHQQGQYDPRKDDLGGSAKNPQNQRTGERTGQLHSKGDKLEDESESKPKIISGQASQQSAGGMFDTKKDSSNLRGEQRGMDKQQQHAKGDQEWDSNPKGQFDPKKDEAGVKNPQNRGDQRGINQAQVHAGAKGADELDSKPKGQFDPKKDDAGKAQNQRGEQRMNQQHGKEY